MFDATKDFVRSLNDIDTLLFFAEEEGKKGDDDSRKLFLKLGVVTSVTKFQVFIEAILEEFRYKLRTSNKVMKDFPLNLRLNCLRLKSEKYVLSNKLNPQRFSPDLFSEIKNTINFYSKICNDNSIIDNDFKFSAKFPMGKSGLRELIKLFKQINGEDIFNTPAFDANKINEILLIRHGIIHDDSNPPLTEETINAYKIFLFDVVHHLDDYLEQFI